MFDWNYFTRSEWVELLFFKPGRSRITSASITINVSFVCSNTAIAISWQLQSYDILFVNVFCAFRSYVFHLSNTKLRWHQSVTFHSTLHKMFKLNVNMSYDLWHFVYMQRNWAELSLVSTLSASANFILNRLKVLSAVLVVKTVGVNQWFESLLVCWRICSRQQWRCWALQADSVGANAQSAQEWRIGSVALQLSIS